MGERTITVRDGHARRALVGPRGYVSAREGAPQPVWVRPFRTARAILGSSGGSARQVMGPRVGLASACRKVQRVPVTGKHPDKRWCIAVPSVPVTSILPMPSSSQFPATEPERNRHANTKEQRQQRSNAFVSHTTPSPAATRGRMPHRASFRCGQCVNR